MKVLWFLGCFLALGIWGFVFFWGFWSFLSFLGLGVFEGFVVFVFFGFGDLGFWRFGVLFLGFLVLV